MSKVDKTAYNEYMRQYMLDRYYARRADAIKTLGGACVVCGSTDDLEIDHIDPRSKEASIAKIWSYSSDRLHAELMKCQLLCHQHHLEKTSNDVAAGKLEQRRKQAPTGIHGTWKMYVGAKCRCAECRAWKRAYRAKLVHSDGTPRTAV